MNANISRILIIEDDKNYITWMKEKLSILGEITIDEGYSVADFYAYYSPGKYNLIVLDLRLESEYEGMRLLEFAVNEDPEAPVIILTGYSTVETAIQALKLGAKEYIEKQQFLEDEEKFTIEFLKKVTKIIIEDKANKLFLQKGQESTPIRPLVGENVNIKHLVKLADIFAEKKISPIFLVGEFGTEKDILAEYIYRKSGAKGRFIKRIIAEKNTDIIQELKTDRKGHGLLEESRRGVLYIENAFNLGQNSKKFLLDHVIGNPSADTTHKKETRSETQIILSVPYIGENEKGINEVDQKIMSMVKTTPLVIPALRERADDIPLLAQYFLTSLKSEGKITATQLSDDVIDYFKTYSWPGNVYELRHTIESAAMKATMLRKKQIKPEDLSYEPFQGGEIGLPRKKVDLERILSEAFVKHLDRALDISGGGKLRAYEYLGYDRSQRGTLGAKVRRIFKTFPDLKAHYPIIARSFKLSARSK